MKFPRFLGLCPLGLKAMTRVVGMRNNELILSWWASGMSNTEEVLFVGAQKLLDGRIGLMKVRGN